MSAVATPAPDLLDEEPLAGMDIDGAAAEAPSTTPQSALPPVVRGAGDPTPPPLPSVPTNESGVRQGVAASATPGQAAAMAVESGRPEDLDWWVSPNYPTSMGGGCHLLSMYLTFPDSEQVKEWNRRLARFPRQVVLPAGWLVDLPALLEREDWGRLDPVRRCIIQSTGAPELAADQPVVDWRWCCRALTYLAMGDPHVNHPSARHEFGWRRDERHLVSVLHLEFPRTRDYRRGKYVVLPK